MREFFSNFYNFLGETSTTLIADPNHQSNRSYLFPIIITLFSTFILTLTIVGIIGAIFIKRQNRLRKNQMASDLRNDKIYKFDEYDNTCIEDDYESIKDELENCNFREYDKINYDELNEEENRIVKYTEILECIDNSTT